jgi:uncharacterized protein (DUF362 family)
MKNNRISRRDFLDYALKGSIALSSTILSIVCIKEENPRKVPINYFISEGKPLLVVVEGKNIKKMLSKGIEVLNGFKEIVKGKNLVIKPNATWSQPYPVTTDPFLLEEIITQAKSAECKKIVVCDGPSSTGFHAHYIFSSLGYFKLRENNRVKVKCIDPIRRTEFVRVKNTKWKVNPSLLISKNIQYADIVINIAIPKRHHAGDFSCALKNCFGCIYDTFRMYAHKKLLIEKEKGEIYFDMALAEFADAVRPELTIVDARSILIKGGPTLEGKAEVKKGINKLIISGDIVAVDSYCAQLMEEYDDTFESMRRVARQIGYAENLGLGTGDLSKVKIVELRE